MTARRWLQRAWWRYLQARWGYSPNIHSWELVNEGDPTNDRHYTLADEFGKYMRQFAPNQHLVTTSFWHSLPATAFWKNASYPNLDYVDLHAYVSTSQTGEFNVAAAKDSVVRARCGTQQRLLQDQHEERRGALSQPSTACRRSIVRWASRWCAANPGLDAPNVQVEDVDLVPRQQRCLAPQPGLELGERGRDVRPLLVAPERPAAARPRWLDRQRPARASSGRSAISWSTCR